MTSFKHFFLLRQHNGDRENNLKNHEYSNVQTNCSYEAHIWGQRIIFNSFNIKTCILSYMMRCQGKHMFSSEVCLRLDKISGCCRRQYISGRGHTAGKQRATTVTVEK